MCCIMSTGRCPGLRKPLGFQPAFACLQFGGVFLVATQDVFTTPKHLAFRLQKQILAPWIIKISVIYLWLILSRLGKGKLSFPFALAAPEFPRFLCDIKKKSIIIVYSCRNTPKLHVRRKLKSVQSTLEASENQNFSKIFELCFVTLQTKVNNYIPNNYTTLTQP